MILKFIIIPLLLLQSGYLSYTNPEKDYSFEINSRASYIRKTLNKSGDYTDIFNVVNIKNSKIVDYIITVSKIGSKEFYTTEVLISSEYKNNFKNSCNCEITSSKLVKYKNLVGILFNIKIKKNSGYMIGYSYTIAKDKSLYNVNYLIAEELAPKYNKEYDYTLNSMKIYK